MQSDPSIPDFQSFARKGNMMETFWLAATGCGTLAAGNLVAVETALACSEPSYEGVPQEQVMKVWMYDSLLVGVCVCVHVFVCACCVYVCVCVCDYRSVLGERGVLSNW